MVEQIWAMPIVFVVDKENPASVIEICEASSQATATILHTFKDNPDASHAFNAWEAGNIRKVVRRTRRTQFEKASYLTGVTLTKGKATVKAFIPKPVDALPDVLKRMQVTGTEPSDRGVSSASALVKIFVTPHFEMSVGKVAAQASHGAHLTYRQVNEEFKAAWAANNFETSVEFPDVDTWEQLQKEAKVSITDAGLTEIPPGTNTILVTY